MKIIIDKDLLHKKINFASRFVSEKITSLPILQGVLIIGEKDELNFYSSNLSSFIHTKTKIKNEKKNSFLIEPKKISEFLGLLPTGQVEIEILDKKIVITQQKTKGTFPLLAAIDFPLPPKIDGKQQKIKTKIFKKNLSNILFSSAKDESRPALTGVNFITNTDLTMVTTDGFRLSLVKTEKQIDHPSLIIPSSFLEEVLRLIDDEEEMGFVYSEEEKVVMFKIGDDELFSRLVEGEFPPFEKVIPEKYLTKTTTSKEELIRAIKLIAVFARDSSNIIVLEFKKDGLVARPKAEKQENSTLIEAKTEGEDQVVAFNYKFLLDFLNHAQEENVIIEILRSDAPVVFKLEKKDNYLHIIMPVRIQE